MVINGIVGVLAAVFLVLYLMRRKARLKSTLEIFQSSPINTFVRLASVS